MIQYFTGVIVSIGILIATRRDWNKEYEPLWPRVLFFLGFSLSSWLGVGIFLGTLGREN